MVQRPGTGAGYRAILAFAVAGAISGCATPWLPPPDPLDFPRSVKRQDGLSQPHRDDRPQALEVSPVPVQPAPQSMQERRRSTAEAMPSAGVDEEAEIAIEQTPLPVFVQVLYGSVLKVAYSLDPAVLSRTDLVTFKTSRPLSRERLKSVAADLLRSYGLAVQDYDGLVRIVPAANAPATPVLLRGTALPETPEPLRPVFHHVELEVVRSAEVAQWLRQILGSRITMQEDGNRNGLLLSGTTADLRSALDVIRALDQPRMRGRIAQRIRPAFSNVTDLAARITEMLAAQGYAVSSTLSPNVPILLLPIPSISSIVVFTNSEETMALALRWARELDRPIAGATSNALFTYAVRYADAQDLAKTLGELLSTGGGLAPSAPAGASAAQARPPGGNRVVVNNATNTLIFRGSTADEYQQIQALLQELDRPAKSALIEVTVAELRRTDATSLGVQWDYNQFGLGAAARNATLGGTGLNLAVTSDSRRVRALVSALASDNLARVLSNPKVMARNGESATIQVGQEVPIITSQQTTGTTTGGLFTSTPNILQTVDYRSTGVILRVRPVINSGNRLDLEIEQEVSSAAATTTGVEASPTISTRRVNTKLSLRDGSTVLLAGLIDRKASGGNSGVPLLKDIPGLGSLFRSENSSSEETELIVMITPYVINDDFEAEGISDAVQAGFGDWARSLKPARLGEKLLEPEPASPRPSTEGLPLPAPASAGQPAGTGAKSLEASGLPAGPRPAETDGVIMSAPGKKPDSPTRGREPQSDSAGTGPASGGKTASEPVRGGKIVEDEKVLEEVRRLIEKPR